jgi:exodeoxyribonuclease V alpha subunit
MAQARFEAPNAAPSEALAGTVERVTFHNAETGFAVLKVKTRGKRDLITVVGHAAAISAGEFVNASGIWVNDRAHGLQFKAQVLKATAPTTSEGIERYLASGQMRGIGPAMAKRIVSAFGEGTFDIIEASPERLKEVSGIGPMRASRIVSAWSDQKAVREIMIFLHSNGVGTARAVRIFKTYGHEAIKIMTEDPYRLARDVRGIGFRSADAIAERLGIEKTAPQRLRAGVSFALQTAMDEGHCGLPVEMLVGLAERLLEVDAALIRTAVAEVLRSGEVVEDTILEPQTPQRLQGALRPIRRRQAIRATRGHTDRVCEREWRGLGQTSRRRRRQVRCAARSR